MAKENVGIISKGNFYGQSSKRKWIGLERSIDAAVKRHQTEKIPSSFPSRILGPSTKWRTFFRQQDAFNFSRSTSKDLHVFAFESDSFEGNTGQRMYLVASYPVFWHYYRQLSAEKRHHYEVIPEGAVCKLYFDLEFDRTVNPSVKGDELIETFIKFICHSLKIEFGIDASRDSVLDLDASTEQKFSRHLVFQSSVAAFQDNIHAGKFVCYALSKLLQKLKQYTPSKAISNSDRTMAKPKDGIRESCTDTGSDSSSASYSFNEDKNNTMDSVNLVEETDIVAIGISNSEDDAKYSDLWRQFSDAELKSLMVKNKRGEDSLFCDTGVYTKNRNFRLFKSSKLHKNHPLELSTLNTCHLERTADGDVSEEAVFYESLVANVQYNTHQKILTFNKESPGRPSCQRKSQSARELESSTLDGYSKSPYPEVDDYITRLITQDSGKGVIRHWTYFQQGELLVYEIAKYRFCHNISRHHKSNNIMLVTDLQKGVFYQKCHDPECHMQNYKSPEWPLPRTVLPSSYFDDLEIIDDDLDSDEELLNTTAELEREYFERNNGRNVEAASEDLSDGEDSYLLQTAETLESSSAEYT